MTRILGGDGSQWLADMAGEDDNLAAENARLREAFHTVRGAIRAGREHAALAAIKEALREG